MGAHWTQLCVASGDASRVSEIYDKVQHLSTAINDPRIMGCVVLACSGSLGLMGRRGPRSVFRCHMTRFVSLFCNPPCGPV